MWQPCIGGTCMAVIAHHVGNIINHLKINLHIYSKLIDNFFNMELFDVLYASIWYGSERQSSEIFPPLIFTYSGKGHGTPQLVYKSGDSLMDICQDLIC